MGWQGVWRVIYLEEELVIFEINRYCKTNYTKDFEASNCVQDKIDTGDVEGLVLLMFSKNEPVMDYFAGSIKLTDLSFSLQTMIHKIHSDSLMTMEEYND